MSKLYDIDKQIAEIIENADPETGEIDFDALDRLKIERESFIEQIALAYKNAIADAEMHKREEQAQKDWRLRYEKQAERTKEYLRVLLNGEKLKTSRVNVSYRKSKQVEVSIDPFDLPDKYLRKKTIEEPDKVAIREALEDGKKIEGCRLVDNVNMNIK